MGINKASAAAAIGLIGALSGCPAKSESKVDRYILAERTGQITEPVKQSELYLKKEFGEDYKCRDWARYPWLGAVVKAKDSMQKIRSRVTSATHCEPTKPSNDPDDSDSFDVVLDAKDQVILDIVAGKYPGDYAPKKK